MDKHDKHNKPGKSRKGGNAAPAKVEVVAADAAPAEKGKGDWPGKPAGKKTR